MRTLPLIVMAALFGTSLTLAAPASAAEAPAAPAEEHGTLYHVVSIKFKDSASPDQIKTVEEAFQNLKTKISGIKSLAWGTNVSPEHRNKGYTHCFVLTFGSAKDRDAYLTDPAHKAFGKLLGPVLDDVFVIDFQAKE